jgi:hypothetical protein
MEFLLIGFVIIGSLSGIMLIVHAIVRTFREFQDQAQRFGKCRLHEADRLPERAEGLRRRSHRAA